MLRLGYLCLTDTFLDFFFQLVGCVINRSDTDNMRELHNCQAMLSELYRGFKLPCRYLLQNSFIPHFLIELNFI